MDTAAVLDDTIDMAKKKTESPRDPDQWERKPIVLAMRGRPEFKAALEELARREGMSITAFVDMAIRNFAKHLGHGDVVIPRR